MLTLTEIVSYSRVPEGVAVELDDREPEKLPLNEPSEAEEPLNVPDAPPEELIRPCKVTRVSIGVRPSLPLSCKTPLLSTLPEQTTKVPAEQFEIVPLADTTKVTLTPLPETV